MFPTCGCIHRVITFVFICSYMFYITETEGKNKTSFVFLTNPCILPDTKERFGRDL